MGTKIDPVDALVEELIERLTHRAPVWFDLPALARELGQVIRASRFMERQLDSARIRPLLLTGAILEHLGVAEIDIGPVTLQTARPVDIEQPPELRGGVRIRLASQVSERMVPRA